MERGWRFRVPERDHRARACLARALPLCLALGVVTPASAQSLTDDLFNPSQSVFSATQPRFRKTTQAGSQLGTQFGQQVSSQFGQQTGQNSILGLAGSIDAPNQDPAEAGRTPIGQIPTYGSPAASGAAGTGYDSTGARKKPAVAKTGTPLRLSTSGSVKRPSGSSAVPLTNNATLPPVPSGPLPTLAPKISPPSSSTANFPPVAPSIAGVIDGQPPRRRLKVDDDPFGATGIYYGSFLSKAAVELSGGYDSNPARISPAVSSAFYVISPELVISSDWDRHALSADLRGSYTGYGTTIPSDLSASSGAPSTLDRPDFTGKIDGRLDVSRLTRINSELRLRIATDNPGNPSIQTGLARYPIFATTGATLGADHDFNRLNVALSGTVDHTSYQWSTLSDGTVSSNDDRDFTQYGGIGRINYDLRPGMKPFVEAEADTRIHDQNIDRYGYQRNSDGAYVKAGTTFELTRLITGEASVGWSTRAYQDQRLDRISGLLTSASLVWTVTPLTTAKFIATSSIDETPIAGVSGVLTHDFTWQVEHAFQRWLVATAKFGYGTSDYQGFGRLDNRYTASTDLVYKLNRTVQIKGQLRHDWLDSNIVGASTQATVITLGVRVQQ